MAEFKIGEVNNYVSQDDANSIFKANIDGRNEFLRIKPLNHFGAPARGATVTLKSNLRTHSKTIDAGSGYLCQMEPVAPVSYTHLTLPTIKRV